MTKLHYSERVLNSSDEELRTEKLSWGASQIVRNEIARRREARAARNTGIFTGIGIVAILVAVVGIVVGL